MLQWLESYQVVHTINEVDVTPQFATAEQEIVEKLKWLIAAYERLLVHA